MVEVALNVGQHFGTVREKLDKFSTFWGFRGDRGKSRALGAIPGLKIETRASLPNGAYGAICQVASGVPGLPLLVNAVPFISQI